MTPDYCAVSTSDVIVTSTDRNKKQPLLEVDSQGCWMLMWTMKLYVWTLGCKDGFLIRPLKCRERFKSVNFIEIVTYQWISQQWIWSRALEQGVIIYNYIHPAKHNTRLLEVPSLMGIITMGGLKLVYIPASAHVLYIIYYIIHHIPMQRSYHWSPWYFKIYLDIIS